MNKNRRDINIFFLWLTGLVIVAHAIMPHDHHNNSVFDLNHATSQQGDHEADSPIHCLNFNDLIVDKTSYSLNNNLNKPIILDALSSIHFKLLFIENPNWATHLLSEHYTEAVFANNCPSRGSPLLKV